MMYKVTLGFDEGTREPFYTVTHYVEGNPIYETEIKHTGRPEAWKDALGRAAKLCIVQKTSGLEYADVEVDDGRIYRVRVEQVR